MSVYNTEKEYEANQNRFSVEEEPTLTENLEKIMGQTNICGFLCEVKSDGMVFWREREFPNKKAFENFINQPIGKKER